MFFNEKKMIFLHTDHQKLINLTTNILVQVWDQIEAGKNSFEISNFLFKPHLGHQKLKRSSQGTVGSLRRAGPLKSLAVSSAPKSSAFID
jgi:hypothetical protein